VHVFDAEPCAPTITPLRPAQGLKDTLGLHIADPL
jgi:hypothetical protein